MAGIDAPGRNRGAIGADRMPPAPRTCQHPLPASILTAMPFLELSLAIAHHEQERIELALEEAGALAVTLLDAEVDTPNEQAILEPGVGETPLWQRIVLSALFAADADRVGLLALLAELLPDLAPEAITMREVADQDWVRATQSQFGPIAIGEGFWIVPSWCEPPQRDAIVLELDPGLAFGTGSHPTTRLCLEWLREAVSGGESVLDYGCGSGILAIAAAKLGAGSVVGTDIDPNALVASEANARANRVDARFVPPDRLRGGESDLVVANILAGPLVLLAPALAARTKPGGRIALSGILDAQADEVAAAYTRWFTLAVWRRLDGWVLVAGTRRTAG